MPKPDKSSTDQTNSAESAKQWRIYCNEIHKIFEASKALRHAQNSNESLKSISDKYDYISYQLYTAWQSCQQFNEENKDDAIGTPIKNNLLPYELFLYVNMCCDDAQTMAKIQEAPLYTQQDMREFCYIPKHTATSDIKTEENFVSAWTDKAELYLLELFKHTLQQKTEQKQLNTKKRIKEISRTIQELEKEQAVIKDFLAKASSLIQHKKRKSSKQPNTHHDKAEYQVLAQQLQTVKNKIALYEGVKKETSKTHRRYTNSLKYLKNQPLTANKMQTLILKNLKHFDTLKRSYCVVHNTINPNKRKKHFMQFVDILTQTMQYSRRVDNYYQAISALCNNEEITDQATMALHKNKIMHTLRCCKVFLSDTKTAKSLAQVPSVNVRDHTQSKIHLANNYLAKLINNNLITLKDIISLRECPQTIPQQSATFHNARKSYAKYIRLMYVSNAKHFYKIIKLNNEQLSRIIKYNTRIQRGNHSSQTHDNHLPPLDKITKNITAYNVSIRKTLATVLRNLQESEDASFLLSNLSARNQGSQEGFFGRILSWLRNIFISAGSPISWLQRAWYRGKVKIEIIFYGSKIGDKYLKAAIAKTQRQLQQDVTALEIENNALISEDVKQQLSAAQDTKGYTDLQPIYMNPDYTADMKTEMPLSSSNETRQRNQRLVFPGPQQKHNNQTVASIDAAIDDINYPQTSNARQKACIPKNKQNESGGNQSFTDELRQSNTNLKTSSTPRATPHDEHMKSTTLPRNNLLNNQFRTSQKNDSLRHRQPVRSEPMSSRKDYATVTPTTLPNNPAHFLSSNHDRENTKTVHSSEQRPDYHAPDSPSRAPSLDHIAGHSPDAKADEQSIKATNISGMTSQNKNATDNMPAAQTLNNSRSSQTLQAMQNNNDRSDA